MKFQIAKIIFLMNLSIMKKILDLIAFRTDKKSETYKYYKQQIMDFFYETMKKMFKTLSEEKIIIRCECKSNLRQGYKECPACGGSGYKNNN